MPTWRILGQQGSGKSVSRRREIGRRLASHPPTCLNGLASQRGRSSFVWCSSAGARPRERALLWPVPDELQPPEEAREERLAQNEVLFRSVNEAIEQQALGFGGLDEDELICECARSGCFDRIALTLKQYEQVRAEGTRFFVVPGHQNVEVEVVVETQSGFVIVEKDGHAGVVADLADPRDGDEGTAGERTSEARRRRGAPASPPGARGSPSRRRAPA